MEHPQPTASYEATKSTPYRSDWSKLPSVCVSALGFLSPSSVGTRLGATGVQRAAREAKLAMEKREEEVKKRVAKEELERLD